MIKISALVLAAATAVAGTAKDTGDGTAALTVSVAGIEQVSGQLVVGLFASGEAWDGGEAITGRRVPVEGNSVSFTLGPVPAGDYGIKLYHDVDGDGELDTNLMGIPSEPFAFSNNARGRFGPAAWEDAVFSVVAGENVHTLDLH